MSGGSPRLPDGFVVRLDPRTRRLARSDGGLALLGLSPGRVLHLAPTARRLLAGTELVVSDAVSAALARRLLDSGVAHPVPEAVSGPPEAEVTVVVPVRDRPDGLRRLLAALAATAPGVAEVIVVDDGSVDKAERTALSVDSADRTALSLGREGCTGGLAGRVRVLRHPTPRGPAAARNTGFAAARTELVAFLDSDVVPEPGWLEPLRAHLADPAVALAAPRIVGLPPAGAPGWLDRYEAARSSLDLGPAAAPILPRTRVAYVPSAALLVRRCALTGVLTGNAEDAVGFEGFDERLHVAEDVDLVLRLHAQGWRLRYEPAARVAHEHRVRPARWWLRKAFYGTGAAPLALRHPGAVPPLVLAPWAAAVCLLVGAQRRAGLVGAVGVTGAAWWRLRRRLTPGLRRPGWVAAQLIGLGLVSAANQTAGLLVRHWWPVAAIGAVLSRRVRRAVLVAALGEGVVDWYRHRHGLDPLRYLLAHRADDLGYGAGLWWGAARLRTLAPLRPLFPGLPGLPRRPGQDRTVR